MDYGQNNDNSNEVVLSKEPKEIMIHYNQPILEVFKRVIEDQMNYGALSLVPLLEPIPYFIVPFQRNLIQEEILKKMKMYETLLTQT